MTDSALPVRLTDASTSAGGTKFYCHRLTYRQMYGPVLDDDLEISHTHFCGDGTITSRNINPMHLIQEKAEVNKARRGCHYYFKLKVQDDFAGVKDACAPTDDPDEHTLISRKEDLVRGWKRDMGQCRRIHNQRNCGVLIDSVWSQDYDDDAEVSVEENLETRAESQVRLSSPPSEIPDSTGGSSQRTIRLPVRSSSALQSSPPQSYKSLTEAQSDDDYEEGSEDSTSEDEDE